MTAQKANTLATNAYVRAASYSADINNKIYTAEFGSPGKAMPITGNPTINVTVAQPANLEAFADAPFGRSIRLLLGSTGSNMIVTVYGKDYLGQPMTATVTVNSTTVPVVVEKPFAVITKVTTVSTTVVPIVIEWANLLGLPYKTTHVLAAQEDGYAMSTVGTITQADTTDPATSTTKAPRGLWLPAGSGWANLSGVFVASATVNPAGNGGLFGIKQA